MNPTNRQHLEAGASESILIPIPSGTVIMRDDRINKIWEVRIDAFYMSRFPMTQRFYKSVVQDNPSSFISDDLPIETISWLNAVLFCNALSYQMGLLPYYNVENDTDVMVLDRNGEGFRLPSEAEWQYTCQAGGSGVRYEDIDEIAWYKENSKGCTQIVGKKQPNTNRRRSHPTSFKIDDLGFRIA